MNTTINLKHKIKKNKIFNTRYVFIDGMSRSGKAAVATVVSSLKCVEHFRIKNLWDRMLMLYESNYLTKQGFRYLVKLSVKFSVKYCYNLCLII